MKYKEMMKNYYGEVYNISELLKKVTDSYRLLIAGAAELNNIPERKEITYASFLRHNSLHNNLHIRHHHR